MFFRRNKERHSQHSSSKRRTRRTRNLSFERLEGRELLAITWVNQGVGANNADGFDILGEGNREVARALVRRAVVDWNAVIIDQNFDRDNNPNTNSAFELTLNAVDLVQDGLRGQTQITEVTTGLVGQGQSGWTVGAPRKAIINVDNNGGSYGWFFDQTPMDDAEFTGIANSGSAGTGAAFATSFIDVNGQAARDDFYRTVVHEIGHALGITSNSNAAIAGMLTPLFRDAGHQQSLFDPTGLSFDQLTRFQSTRPSPQYGVTATFTGAHIYEGDLYGTNNDPTTVYAQGSATPIAFETHPNELLNPGRSVPAGHPDPPPPRETARQFISDLEAKILADAYGYTVVLPSTFNTAHVTLDSLTGTLLVQGGVTSAGDSQNDAVAIDTVGSDICVRLYNTGAVNYATEKVPAALVSQIIVSVAGDSGVPSIAGINVPVQFVDRVVSSNQDSVDIGTLGDGRVDIDPVVPGNQVALRAAIMEANSLAGGSIYVPRGRYRLTLQGTGGDAQGDLEITQSVVLLGIAGGSGPATRVAWMPAVADDVFELIGDYNSDGVVNSSDHMFWSGQNGNSGSNLAADGNDDGIVDSDDDAFTSLYSGNTLSLTNVVVG